MTGDHVVLHYGDRLPSGDGGKPTQHKRAPFYAGSSVRIHLASPLLGDDTYILIEVVLVVGLWRWCQALMKLSRAMDKLSKVVFKEVPGTLLSLKLSAREINELTQQLSSLR